MSPGLKVRDKIVDNLKDGRPIYVEHLGKVNMSELRAITTETRMLQAYVVACETFHTHRLPACSQLMGRPVTNLCTILDLRGLTSGLRLFWDVKSYLQQTSHIGQNYYPESLGKMYVVNAPWVFATVWSVVRGWLDPVTAAKVTIVNGNGRKELLEQIDEDSLPSELGGSCKCPGGCEMSDAGPWQAGL